MSEETNKNRKTDHLPLASMPLAEAYVPIQSFEDVYPSEEGIKKGTIFPSLYKPYNKRGE
ncbi:MAG: spore coat associated protein CotJA [Defluviitaleaceae bacterium]|nr:spore coat associated protein CotJA [Defluviitaleaceae bacterium]